MANSVILTGFLGQDPESKTLDNGSEVVRLNLATDDGYKDAQGNWVSKTHWHSIICWRNAAKKAKEFRKGNKIFARGKNVSRSYQNKEGKNVYIYEVEAFEVEKIDLSKK